MGEYNAGLATKNKIISVCKSLFYKFGINETTYTMICDEADITRGLLPYHFSSKDNIAFLIYDEFLNDFESWMDKIPLDNSSYACRFAVSNYVFHRFLFTNMNFMRFYWQLKSSDKLKTENIEIQLHTINRLTEYNNTVITKEEMNTISCMIHGAEREIFSNYYSGFIREDGEKVATKDIVFVLSMLEYDSAEIREIMDYSLIESKKYQISMSDSFIYSFNPSV